VAEKKRVFKLAEEIKVESQDIISFLKGEGVEGVSAASFIDAEKVAEIKEHFSAKKKKKAAKAEAEVPAKPGRRKSKGAETPEVKPEEGTPPDKEAPLAIETPAPLPLPTLSAPAIHPVPPPPPAAPIVTAPGKSSEKTEAKTVETKPPIAAALVKEAPAKPHVVAKETAHTGASAHPAPPLASELAPAPPPPVAAPKTGPVKRVIPRPGAGPVAPSQIAPGAKSGMPSSGPSHIRPRKPLPAGSSSPSETIRQHSSSKFGGMKTTRPGAPPAPGAPRPAQSFGPRPGGAPRPFAPRPGGPGRPFEPRSGAPQGRFGRPGAASPPPADASPAPTRDHRGGAAKGRPHRQYEKGKQEGTLKISYGRPSAVDRPAPFTPLPVTKKITLTEGGTIKELADRLEVKAKDLIRRLLDKGVFATMNQVLDESLAIDLAKDFGAEAEIISIEENAEYEAIAEESTENQAPRPPVVTVMGHVDHGKTSLLDAIRETNVTASEAGGITQHIGAYQVVKNDRIITFLDTPGHEAFTMMRARGAKVTDIVVLVVAADDGVMPQTLEAINHARAAKVPIVVAINKIDKSNAQVERVKKTLADQGLMSEEWGGDTVTVEVSAKQKTNLDLLLEMILLVADMQAIRANPHRTAVGTILEAKLDKGRGPVATVLIQNGTLHVGDAFIAGPVIGKVRAMFDYRGKGTKEAGPSTPAEVLGLQAVPQAGDLFQVMTDISKVKQIGNLRQIKLRESQLAKTARLSLEHLHEQLKAGAVKELPIVLKADVHGSVEVLTDTLNKISSEKVKVKIIHRATGAITENDVLLASASNAIVIGFNVRPERKAAELAENEEVDVRLHTIIYNVTSEIKSAMLGMLDKIVKETRLGSAEVRTTFKVPKVGTIAGCYVLDGKIVRNAQIRLLRDNVVIYEGKISSLRRFKDDASEVRSGFECGIGLENYQDIKDSDVVEAFVIERVAAEVL
jgi:translation initiation factor IF-2